MDIAIDSGAHRIGEGGPLRRLELLCGLTTVGRQTVAFLVVAWCPLLAFGLVHEAVTARADPLLHHVATHVRLLVAAPLFLLLDAWFPALCRQMLALLVEQSFVADDDRERFDALVRRAKQRSDSWVVEAMLVVLAVGLGAAALFGALPVTGLSVRTGPAISRIWFALVSLPLVEFLLLRSLWRWAVWGTILVELARLGLKVVPTHPDRCGGIAFLRLPSLRYCTVFLFAVASVMAAEWGDRLAVHADPSGLRPVLLLFVTVAIVVAIGPTLVLTPQLQAARYAGLQQIAELSSRANRHFHERFAASGGQDVPDAVEAQGLAAITALYQETVDKLQYTLFRRSDLLVLAAATTFPVIVALVARVPARDWMQLGGSLFGGVGL